MVFYPDNIPRRNRALQLQDDISLIQLSVIQAQKDMETADTHLSELSEKAMKHDGIDTLDKLQEKLQDTLTDEQRKQYDAILKASKLNSVKKTDPTIKAITYFLYAASGVRHTLNIINVLRACRVMAIFRLYGSAFIKLMVKGIDAGVAAFQLVTESITYLTDALEASSKVARYTATASRWLKTIGSLGPFVDALVLAMNAYEQNKQRAELRRVIKELYVSRIAAQFFANMCSLTKTWNGILISYLTLSSVPELTPSVQTAMDKLGHGMVDLAQKYWADTTPATALDALVLMDIKRGSWINEDPPYQQALEAAEKNLAFPEETLEVESVPTIPEKLEVHTMQKSSVPISVAPIADSIPVPSDDVRPTARVVANDAFDIAYSEEYAIKDHHHTEEKLESILAVAEKRFEPLPVEKVFQYLVFVPNLSAETVEALAAAW
ncbi:hypothetical protein CERSUDRAFT_111849 [Gelatoporia subvermispora B]|uniref:Uncharacterized protein n=1 Tax=Ceriporiopsis subvermispora (strain B) TaxID=914234 RepID=M2PSA3_CERS8|nr:hypothetical protein CERSUDRAFT_111849 [Gelatoporia subvermispora B]